MRPAFTFGASTTLFLTWVRRLAPAKLERNEIEAKGKTQGAAVRLWRHARIPGFRIAGARILARRAQARCTRARARRIRGARGDRSGADERAKKASRLRGIRAFFSRLDDGGRNSARGISRMRGEVWRDTSRGHALARGAGWHVRGVGGIQIGGIQACDRVECGGAGRSGCEAIRAGAVLRRDNRLACCRGGKARPADFSNCARASGRRCRRSEICGRHLFDRRGGRALGGNRGAAGRSASALHVGRSREDSAYRGVASNRLRLFLQEEDSAMGVIRDQSEKIFTGAITTRQFHPILPTGEYEEIADGVMFYRWFANVTAAKT